jgi:hypothetical protein
VLAAWRSGSKHHECTRFYRKHCLVFEGPMQRKTERQLICRKRKCRNALKASQRPSANNSLTERSILVRVLQSRGCVQENDMDRRDWELLDKQMRLLQPAAPAPSGMIVSMLVGIFIFGVATGALLFTSGSPSVQTAGDGKAALAFLLNGPRQTP